jgi:L-lysine 2,3-aminomutase/uncharacterized NAD(P)/FAD-binding protein YdhS
MTGARSDGVVALVGTGPRGLSVLERLLLRAEADPDARPLDIWTIDDVEPGVGRIWRVDQSRWPTMNTVAGEVTMYSAPADLPTRLGAGPSLVSWAARHDDPAVRAVGPGAYAPRYVYGLYLRSVYRALCALAPPHARVRPYVGRVVGLEPAPPGWALALETGDTLTADSVVLATGHSRYRPDPVERGFLGRAGARYVRGDSAADLPLDGLGPGDTVGLIGLGLSFHDVVVMLTSGRGGRFAAGPGGRLRYRPSGQEPRIVAGSRSGLPYPARGRNQKPAEHVHRPVFLAEPAVSALRAAAVAATGGPQLDFVRDVWPLLLAEIQLLHDVTVLRGRAGAGAAADFADRVRAERTAGYPVHLRGPAGIADTPLLDLRRLADPLAGRRFGSAADFRALLLDRLAADLAAAEVGNLDHPVKAALDALRDVRSTLRGIVDFGGLTPASHRRDFLGWFHGLYNCLAAGPPRLRIAQLAALVAAGAVELVGPDVQVGTDPRTGAPTLSSPRVAGSGRTVDLLVDARLPRPDVRRDTSPLIRQLLERGHAVEYRNGGSDGFDTGGLAVDPATFAAVDASGRPVAGLFALGIPTEHTRWFTHMGSGRPGRSSLFGADAERVAAGVWSALAAGRPDPGRGRAGGRAGGAPVTAPRPVFYTARHLGALLQRAGVDAAERRRLQAVAAVLPFRVNGHVVEELIDWSAVPDDPIFQLTFPQAGMLAEQARAEIERLLPGGAGELAAAVRRVRLGLRPHPGGQLTLNSVHEGDTLVPGLQHKYAETVLVFPRQGQSCHSYCSYCFRWAQFVGEPDLHIATGEPEAAARYVRGHPEVSSVLVTGGDPMVMSTAVLRRYVEPLLAPGLEHVTSIRFGTKALAYWPYRFFAGDDAADLLRLFEQIRASGRHVTVMAHWSHPRELQHDAARRAVAAVLGAGAAIRAQAPLIAHVNDDAAVWAELWSEQVRAGAVPYYLFVERDTGPSDYFAVPLARAHEIFTAAYRQVSGLARTVRGPVMSATPGKVCVDGVLEVGGQRCFVLRLLQARNAELVNQPFLARYDPAARWLTDLQPATGRHFPFERGPAVPGPHGPRIDDVSDLWAG